MHHRALASQEVSGSGVSSDSADMYVRRHLSPEWIWASLLRSAQRFTVGCARYVALFVTPPAPPFSAPGT
eukprot:3685236-Rhodomonas_salina.1